MDETKEEPKPGSLMTEEELAEAIQMLLEGRFMN
jgi:hypothetical protein